jgi:hypothetical protein
MAISIRGWRGPSLRALSFHGYPTAADFHVSGPQYKGGSCDGVHCLRWRAFHVTLCMAVCLAGFAAGGQNRDSAHGVSR